MNAIKKIILISSLFCFPFSSFGWGVLGHRIVGEIADSYLTPKAKAAIKKILGTESIAMASNWADFIKSDTAYNYMSNWHYLDIDSGLTTTQLQQYLKKDTGSDLYTRINFLVNELRNKQLPMDKRRTYLKLLIHFIGDAHQPLHVGHHEDQGGNKIKLTWFSTPTNLHRVWDEHLVDFQQLSYTEYTKAINHTSAKERLAWQKQPVSDWIIESYQIAQQLYHEIQPDQKLSYRYNFDHVKILNEQLLKAGVRLAGLLNRLFG
ncbi:MAG TPA: S1/P1 nuclease [Chitinophagaceae bacterium]|nr:S1/P1 nuclease [Chitinophagaceae bacterium]